MTTWTKCSHRNKIELWWPISSYSLTLCSERERERELSQSTGQLGEDLEYNLVEDTATRTQRGWQVMLDMIGLQQLLTTQKDH